tara:strand:+ start:43790 stop:43900 length:111 start_codon:yes stop_codon:yes gene_type:complete
MVVVRERHDLHPGDDICFTPDASQAHLFDRENGERI